MNTEVTTAQMRYTIAKFMGYEKVTVGYTDTEEETEWQRNHEEWMIKVGIRLVGDYIVDVPNNVWHSWEDVKYQTSWGWLMPVWNKLRTTVQLDNDGDYPADFSTMCDVWENACFEVNISNAHYLVHDAIQWYNQQKQTNDQ